MFAQVMAGFAAEEGESTTMIIDATYLNAHRTVTSLVAQKGGAGA